jgi:threonine dehydratase
MTSAARIDRDAIRQTEALIRPHIRRTPVLRCDLADFGGAPCALALKLESHQHSGSFKARGAIAAMIAHPAPPAGVVAASGGNHGAAVAWAAGRLGLPATIFVPEIVSPAKARRIEGYGARLIVGGARYADALAASEVFAAESGARPIHAFDQEETLLGQGTLGLEIAEDVPDAGTVLVAVGGGGLIGGIAAWFAGARRVVAVEPEAAPTLHSALAAGRPVDAPAGGIAADSLAPRQVGRLMFPIACAHVAESVLVPDEEIRRAQAALWETLRVVAEPGGAAAFAAVLGGRYRPRAGETVCVVVCGANTDAVRFDAL